MTYRNLDALLYLKETVEFKDSFIFQATILNHSFWLYNNECGIRCYGLEVEDFLYMTIIDFKRMAEISIPSLFSSIPSKELKHVYKQIQEEINISHLKPAHPKGLHNALLAERYYVTYLRTLSLFFDKEIKSGFNDCIFIDKCSDAVQKEIQLLINRKST